MTNLDGLFIPALAFGAGIILGAAFQLTLWWTVVRGLHRKTSALWFPGSLLLRMGVTVTGFYLVGEGQWQRYLACLAGFLIAQFLVAWMIPGAAVRPRRSIDRAS